MPDGFRIAHGLPIERQKHLLLPSVKELGTQCVRRKLLLQHQPCERLPRFRGTSSLARCLLPEHGGRCRAGAGHPVAINIVTKNVVSDGVGGWSRAVGAGEGRGAASFCNNLGKGAGVGGAALVRLLLLLLVLRLRLPGHHQLLLLRRLLFLRLLLLLPSLLHPKRLLELLRFMVATTLGGASKTCNWLRKLCRSISQLGTPRGFPHN